MVNLERLQDSKTVLTYNGHSTIVRNLRSSHGGQHSRSYTGKEDQDCKNYNGLHSFRRSLWFVLKGKIKDSFKAEIYFIKINNLNLLRPM